MAIEAYCKYDKDSGFSKVNAYIEAQEELRKQKELAEQVALFEAYELVR